MAKHLQRKEYAAALDVLSSAESDLAHLDSDGYLEKCLIYDRGMVFEAQGKWAEALSSFEERLKLPFGDASEESVTLLGCALVLQRLERQNEAQGYMERVLDTLSRAHPAAALPKLLKWLAEGNDSVFCGRGELIASALHAYKLAPPVDPHIDPIGALNWAAEEWKRARPSPRLPRPG